MKTPWLLSLVIVAVLLVSVVCVWFVPSIQDFMAGNSMWNGISSFSHDFRTDNIDSLAGIHTLPETSTLIAIPYLPYSDAYLEATKHFIEDGGTLLLMDDFGFGNSVLSYLGLDARFDGRVLLDPLFCYRNPAMPRITDFRTPTNGVQAIVFNRGTVIINVANAAAIAWSSSSSYLQPEGGQSAGAAKRAGPFVVAASYKIGQGNVVIVSDPSVLLNSMVERDDNRAFIESLMGNAIDRTIAIDRSHLTKTPLDVSKARLTGVRRWLSNSYVLVGLTAIVFFALSTTIVRKGETVELRENQ